MKAVVVEVRGRHAVLLTDSGAFVRVADHGYRAGQQITFSPTKKLFIKPLMIAASLLICFVGAAGLAADRIPVSYVSLDVNPSMEFSLNWFDRVLSVKAVNEDAEPIVQQLLQDGVVNRSMDAAISMAVTSLNKAQYITSDVENDMVIAVASYGLKDVKGFADRLSGSAESLSLNKHLKVTAIDTDLSKVEEARQYHTTAGKLVLAQEAAAIQKDMRETTVEELLQKPVREILRRRQESAQPDSATDGQGKGNAFGGKQDKSSQAPLWEPSPSPEGDVSADDLGTGLNMQLQGTDVSQTAPPTRTVRPPAAKKTPGALTSPTPSPSSTGEPAHGPAKDNNSPHGQKPGSTQAGPEDGGGEQGAAPDKNKPVQQGPREGSGGSENRGK